MEPDDALHQFVLVLLVGFKKMHVNLGPWKTSVGLKGKNHVKQKEFIKAREQRQISVTLKMTCKFAHFLQIEPRDSRSLHFF